MYLKSIDWSNYIFYKHINFCHIERSREQLPLKYLDSTRYDNSKTKALKYQF